MLLCGVLPTKAQSYPFVTDRVTVDGILYFILNDGTASVVVPTENTNPTIINIPEKITLKNAIYPIKRISNNAFRDCSNLTTIHLPAEIIEIGHEAFFGCTSLQQIELPKSLQTIQYRAFSHCANLNSISLPDSLLTIEDEAFAYCSSLKSIKIPLLITELAYGIFSNCSNLTSVFLPNTLEILWGSNFEQCSHLSSIKVYSDKYDNNSFSTQESIVLPESLKHIGYNAFAYCTELTGNLRIPSSVTKIEFAAFSRCSSISSIELPSGITSIEEETFYGCDQLCSINIPPTVTTIGSKSFYYCGKLRSLSFPESLTSIHTSSIGMTGIKSACFFGTTPPTVIGDDHLYWLNWDTSFYVPKESLDSYKVWFDEYYSENIKPIVKPVEGAKSVEISPTSIPIVKGVDTTLNVKAIVTTNSGNRYDGIYSWKTASQKYADFSVNNSDPSKLSFKTNSDDIIIVTVFTSDGNPITATSTIESIKIDCPIDKITMIPGDNYKIETAISPSNYENNLKIRFTSDLPEIARVNENTGEITAISEGQTTILVEVCDEAGNTVATHKCKVYVCTGIVPIYASMTIQVNQSVPLMAQLKPEDDYWPVDAINVVSHDESVARLNSYGNLQGFKVGETTIDCSYLTTTNYEYRFSYNVKVVDEITDFEISADNEANTMTIGSTIQLNAILDNGDPLPVYWYSQDSKIADIGFYNGKVTAKNIGKCTFEAVPAINYLPSKLYEITIIEKGEISKISLNKTTINLAIGEKEQLMATFDNENINANITWSSTDETIATVDASGEVTAIGEGLCDIIATVDGTDISAKCTVEVNKLSGIIDTNNNSIHITTTDNQITVTGIPNNQRVRIYNTTGSCISSTQGDSTVNVTTGIYIVKIGNDTFKVAVK